ncbi:XenA [Pseudomonas putida S11]|nr:XenA [Pseudomonas putida S11]
MSALFEPYTLKDVTLRNRIAIPPMCQYMAEDGMINDWHHVHLAGLARGGAGLLVVEATAVAPGRAHHPRVAPASGAMPTPRLSCRWCRQSRPPVPCPGIQIAHAGRKASANRPWEGDDHIAADDARGWETIAPSAIAFGAHLPRVPREMTLDDIARVKQDFVDAARRARDAGFEWIELHFAHGYLGQSFFSEHSNKRTDAYGGSFDNRSRFLLETLAAVREVWPENLPLTARFGVLEYDGRDEQTLEESIELARRFKAGGLDLLSVSVGFTIPDTNIPWGPAFMGPIAERVRREAKLPVTSAWGFGTPKLAEAALQANQLDLVSVGRAHLADPHWAYFAAKELGVEKDLLDLACTVCALARALSLRHEGGCFAAHSRVNPLPQDLHCPQGLRDPCGSGFTREEASTG